MNYPHDDARIEAQMRSEEAAGRQALRDACLDRDLLMAAITLVLFPGRGHLEAFCEDYSIDTSIDELSNSEVLRLAFDRIWENRRRRYPAPPEAPKHETLPVADIPLGLADP